MWLMSVLRSECDRRYRGYGGSYACCRSKQRIYFWIKKGTLPNNGLIVFARSDDYFFGILQSRIHTVWSLAKGTQVREKKSGFRYTPTTTFEDGHVRPVVGRRASSATAAGALKTFWP